MLTIMKVTGQWLFLLFSGLVLDLLGLLVVAIAIPFRVDGISASDGRPIVNLPRWAWIWGNDYDGLLGDKLGKWATLVPFGAPVTGFFAMWWWAAIRNPANNMRFVGIWQAPAGGTITYKGDYKVSDHGGQGGWQFVTKEKDGRHWYGFYLVHEWSSARAFIIRLGFKVEPDDAEALPETKGYTMKVNLYKDMN